MEKKIAVYICTGCGIGDALDIDALSKVASKEYKADICKTDAFLCGKSGIELIKQDIQGEGANTIVVAACSSRVNILAGFVFSFGSSILLQNEIGITSRL